jgi:hypothetical protein
MSAGQSVSAIHNKINLFALVQILMAFTLGGSTSPHQTSMYQHKSRRFPRPSFPAQSHKEENQRRFTIMVLRMTPLRRIKRLLPDPSCPPVLGWKRLFPITSMNRVSKMTIIYQIHAISVALIAIRLTAVNMKP